MSYLRREVILTPTVRARHRQFGLQPGTKLRQCSSGFTWNDTVSAIGPHQPEEVTVIKEYEAHILVEARFASGDSYRESINKCAVRGGYCYFLPVPEGV